MWLDPNGWNWKDWMIFLFILFGITFLLFLYLADWLV